ncbi:MAG: hypothetical protein HRU15_09990, partial [Planctomycetes bacterium]|nr:hypothetical protein [Planctomycetota bacterium]
ADAISTPTTTLTIGALTFDDNFTGSLTLESPLIIDSANSKSGSLTLNGTANNYSVTTLDSDTSTNHNITLDGSLDIVGGSFLPNASTITIGNDGTGNCTVASTSGIYVGSAESIILAGTGNVSNALSANACNNISFAPAGLVTTLTGSCRTSGLVTFSGGTFSNTAYTLYTQCEGVKQFTGAGTTTFSTTGGQWYFDGSTNIKTIIEAANYGAAQTILNRNASIALEGNTYLAFFFAGGVWNGGYSEIFLEGFELSTNGFFHGRANAGNKVHLGSGGKITVAGNNYLINATYASTEITGTGTVSSGYEFGLTGGQFALPTGAVLNGSGWNGFIIKNTGILEPAGGSITAKGFTVQAGGAIVTGSALTQISAEDITIDAAATCDLSNTAFTMNATGSITDSAGTAFNDLIIDDAATGLTTTMQTALDINGDLTLTDGIFDMNSLNISLAGNYFAHSTDAQINAQTGDPSITLDGSANATFDAGSNGVNHDFENLIIAKTGGARVDITGTNCLINDLITLTSGELRITTGQNITVAAATLNVPAAATLSGAGSITTPVTFADNAILAPGDGAIGTLSVTGNVILNNATALAFECDSPGTSDVLAVTGTLTLDGTITISNAGSLAAGTYTIMTHSGVLTNSILDVIMPAGFVGTIDTGTANQIRLVVTDTIDYVWDGGGDGSTWSDPLNWVGDNGFPNSATETATINATADNISTPTSTLTIGALTMDNSFTGTLNLEAALIIDSASGKSGDLLMNGTAKGYTFTTLDSDTTTSHNLTLDGSLLVNGGHLRPNASTVSIGNNGTGNLLFSSASDVYTRSGETIFLAGSGTISSTHWANKCNRLQQGNGVTTTLIANFQCFSVVTGDATSTIQCDGSGRTLSVASQFETLGGANLSSASGTLTFYVDTTGSIHGGDFKDAAYTIGVTSSQSLDAAITTTQDLSIRSGQPANQCDVDSAGFAMSAKTLLLTNNTNTDRGGTLTLSGNSNLNLSGDVVLYEDDTTRRSALIVDTAGTSAINVGGSWTINTNAEFDAQLSTVTFTSGVSETITSNAQPFYHLTFDDQGAGSANWQLQDALDVDGNLSITDGVFDMNSLNISVAGNYSAHTTDAQINAQTGDPSITLDGSANATFDAGSNGVNHDFENLIIAKTAGARVDITGNDCLINDLITLTSGELRVTTGQNITVAAATLNVPAAATLSGAGSITTPITFADAANLAPGDGALGTLSVTGDVILNDTTALAFECDSPGTSDLVAITGNLTLDGVLTISNAGSLAAGTYTLFTHSGTLVNNIVSVSMPNGFAGTIDTSISNQVDLLVISGADYIWDGTGDGTNWNDANNWTADSGYPLSALDTATINATADAISTPTTTLTIGALTFDDNFTGSLTLESPLIIDSANSKSGSLTL